MSDLSFRHATDADWPAIWSVMRRVIEPGDTYMFDPSTDEAAARDAWLFDGRDRRCTFLALSAGAPVGTAILKPNQPSLGDHVANAAWMVRPDLAGRGIGRAFATFVINEARRLGFEALQFNAVVASNQRALRLWESIGMRIVGTVPDAFRHRTLGPTGVHIMHARLDDLRP